jgi:predicted phage terminase large subunit-like protein
MFLDKELELQLKREVYSANYFEFFKWAFNILEPQTKYEDAFHVKYICDLLQTEVERIIRREGKDKDIILNLPPRSSKSKILSQVLLAWVWTRAPQLKMISVSYSEKLAISNSKYCKDIIKSDEYQELFGDIFQIRKDIDSGERFANDKGGERLTTTVSGTITGFGAELICVDDPQDPATAESEVERERVKRYWTETLYNRLTPLNLGIRILLQQRLHVSDLSGFLLEKNSNGFVHVCLPAELTDDVKPVELKEQYKEGLLDPIRLSKKELIKLEDQGGSRYYSGQYLQTPILSKGGILKAEWFDIVDPITLTRDLINEPIHFILDTAYTEKATGDPTAILACFKKGNFLYVLSAIEKRLEFPQLIRFIKEHVQQFQISPASRIFIEGAASGKSIIQQLRDETMLNVVEIKAPDKDKVTRVNAIAPICEGKRVKLVAGPYIPTFVMNLTSFPLGKFDDLTDVLTHAVDQLLVNDSPDYFFV